MKIIAGLALLGLVGSTGVAVAQDPPAKPAAAPAGDSGDNTSYKAKTVYDFEDDMVEGDLQRPDGELVDGIRKTQHSSLIEIRKDFIPEIIKSAEDL